MCRTQSPSIAQWSSAAIHSVHNSCTMGDLITLSECQEVVKNYSEKADDHGASSNKVISYQVKPFGDSVLGFLGEYFRLIVQIERNVSGN